MLEKFDHYRLGETDQLVDIDTAEEHRDAILHMARQSMRSIHIISRALDPQIYDSQELSDALTNMVLEHRRVKILILVFDCSAIVSRGHRLVEAAHRLSSFFDIRTPGPEFKDYNSGVFIADATGYVQRQTATRYEGQVNFNDARHARIEIKTFEEMWGKATLDSNLRRIKI